MRFLHAQTDFNVIRNANSLKPEKEYRLPVILLLSIDRLPRDIEFSQTKPREDSWFKINWISVKWIGPIVGYTAYLICNICNPTFELQEQ